jgi:hypothetical protein
MTATILTIAAMFMFVLLPALIPAAVHAVHAVRNFQPRFAPARGFAVPAAA